MRSRIFAEENRKWWTLGSLCFALFMIMLDNTVVNVALPAIKTDLGISTSELEWTVAAYAVLTNDECLGAEAGDWLAILVDGAHEERALACLSVLCAGADSEPGERGDARQREDQNVPGRSAHKVSLWRDAGTGSIGPGRSERQGSWAD